MEYQVFVGAAGARPLRVRDCSTSGPTTATSNLSGLRTDSPFTSGRRAYDAHMATAEPSSTPNPDATKFTLDTKLAEMFNVTSEADAAAHPFAAAVFAAGGVATVFGVNDFVTVTRQPGADWSPIIAAVQAAAAEHLG
jgi:hypothetical protein